MFSGDLRKYKMSRDKFLSLVPESNYSPLKKFTLLKSKLRDDALQAVEPLEVEACNSIYVYFVMQQMDRQTKSRFEDFLGWENASQMPTLTDLDRFMTHEYQVSTNEERYPPIPKQNEQRQNNDEGRKKPERTKAHITQSNEERAPRKLKCFICTEEHVVKDCPKFLAAEDREAMLRNYKLCIYCIGHRFDFRRPCAARGTVRCDICGKDHLTILHNPKTEATKALVTLDEAGANDKKQVILPTAIATIVAPTGEEVKLKCLVDQCSQSSYITEEMVQLLGLKKCPTNVTITGFSGNSGVAKSMVKLQLKLANHPDVVCQALVVKRVTTDQPKINGDFNWTAEWNLADPHFTKKAQIPVLLGSNVLPQLFEQDTKVIY